MHYIVYTGQRGQFSVNSKAYPGQKLRVRPHAPFGVDDGDLWIASLPDMVVLSTVTFVPTTIRRPHGDPTYCSQWEGAFLEGLVANCPDPARIVEIGTGKGSSLVRILYGLALHEDVRVWTIDLLEQEEAHEALIEAQVPNWRVDFLVGDSVEIGSLEGWEKLDLILVDGSHAYEGVIADVEAWAPHLKDDGVMVFHDYGNPLHEVTPAVDEVMAKGWKRVGLVGTLAAYVRVA